MKKNNNDLLTVGLAQMSPVWLNKKKTIEKIINYIGKASKKNCDLIVFSEAMLPGYPFWIELTDGARFNSKIQKELHAYYVSQAVRIPDGDLRTICQACKKNKVAAVLGTIELAADRGNHSIYCTLVYIDKSGVIKTVHRKLMPTYEERLSWSAGDGHGLQTHRLGAFTIGALNCWENWMPLVRSSLYAMGEDLHIAIWPGNVRNTENITRFIAQESRSFVISVSGVLKSEHITTDIPHHELIKKNCGKIIANGGSCLAGPDGKWLLEPIVNEEGLFVHTINHQHVREERQNFDPSGHYSRPDVTQLIVNRQRQSIISLID